MTVGAMVRRKQFSEGVAIGAFTCNVCGTSNESDADVEDRESATCVFCRSSMRFRAVVLVLSRALFGMDLQLGEFPRLKSLRGLGISDSEIYADRLAQRFGYINTFYHREPTFDLSRPDQTEFGKYDFVICSDVLEHIPFPVESSFEALARLLKPCGFLIVTVPYTLADQTIEHFPKLHVSGLAEMGGKPILVNRAEDGDYEVFDQLVFHGGIGSTLEMRVFCEADIRAKLKAAGFSETRFESLGSQKFGVNFAGGCSLPIIATKEPFSLRASGISELTEQLVMARALLSAAKSSRWVRLGRFLGLGPEIRPDS